MQIVYFAFEHRKNYNDKRTTENKGSDNKTMEWDAE
jgi:hypothetical protein